MLFFNSIVTVLLVHSIRNLEKEGKNKSIGKKVYFFCNIQLYTYCSLYTIQIIQITSLDYLQVLPKSQYIIISTFLKQQYIDIIYSKVSYLVRVSLLGQELCLFIRCYLQKIDLFNQAIAKNLLIYHLLQYKTLYILQLPFLYQIYRSS